MRIIRANLNEAVAELAGDAHDSHRRRPPNGQGIMTIITPQDYARAIARETEVQALDCVRCPVESLERSIDAFRRAGYKIARRPNWVPNANQSRIRAGRLLLPANWDSKSPLRRATIVEHELVHLRQRQTVRWAGWRYTMVPRWQWVFEVQAYGQGYLASARMGQDLQVVRNKASTLAERLRDLYRAMRVIAFECLRRFTRLAIKHLLGLLAPPR